MITLAIILFFIIMPGSRPYILGFVALIAVSLLIGWLMPDFFWEEPAFWVRHCHMPVLRGNGVLLIGG